MIMLFQRCKVTQVQINNDTPNRGYGQTGVMVLLSTGFKQKFSDMLCPAADRSIKGGVECGEHA